MGKSWDDEVERRAWTEEDGLLEVVMQALREGLAPEVALALLDAVPTIEP